MLHNKREMGIGWVVMAGLLWLQLSLPVHAETSDCPENAAVFYYQAFENIPDLTIDEYEALGAVKSDHTATPDALGSYVTKWKTSLDLARTASRIADCNWGHVYSEGVDAYANIAVADFSKIRRLVFAFYAEAVAHAHDGRQDAALENGLTVQRIATHVGHGSLAAHLTTLAVESYAAKTLRMALGYGTASAETLSWVQGQWITRRSSVASCFVAFDYELRLTESTMAQPNYLEGLRADVRRGEYPGNMDQMSDADFLTYVLAPHRKFIADMKRIMSLDTPHIEKEYQVEALSAATALAYEQSYPPDWADIFSYGGAHFRVYTLSVRNDATVMATQLAIELYDITRQSGELPSVLPSHLPKDPFTKDPFDYEIVSDGFVLRFWEPSDSGEGFLTELAFHVPGIQNDL